MTEHSANCVHMDNAGLADHLAAHVHTARCLDPVRRVADCDKADLDRILAASDPVLSPVATLDVERHWLDQQRKADIAGGQWPSGVSDGLRTACSDCGQHVRFDYIVADDFWRRWVPGPEHAGVVCLPCLDRRSGGVGLADALVEVQWTGTGHTVVLRPTFRYEYARQPTTGQPKSGDDEGLMAGLGAWERLAAGSSTLSEETGYENTPDGVACLARWAIRDQEALAYRPVTPQAVADVQAEFEALWPKPLRDFDQQSWINEVAILLGRLALASDSAPSVATLDVERLARAIRDTMVEQGGRGPSDKWTDALAADIAAEYARQPTTGDATVEEFDVLADHADWRKRHGAHSVDASPDWMRRR